MADTRDSKDRGRSGVPLVFRHLRAPKDRIEPHRLRLTGKQYGKQSPSGAADFRDILLPMPWQVRLVRLTLFPVPGVETWNVAPWRELTGADPENRVTPRPGLRAEEGTFRSGRLELQWQLSPQPRADLVYRAIEPPGAEYGRASLGTLAQAVEALGTVPNTFLNGPSQFARVAFGAEHFQTTPTVAAAYEILGTCISMDVQGASDLVYQINRPRPSSVITGLRINRLAKWSASRLRLVTLDADSGMLRTEGTGTFAAELNTDVNTDGGRVEAIPQEMTTGLLRELQQLTDEIGERGDVR